jgi:twinkle protein
VNLNTGQWCCNRKNNCGESGGVNALRDLYGDKPAATTKPRLTGEPKARSYAKPERKPGQLADAGAAFFASRGLNDLTVAAWRCGQDKLVGVGEAVSWPVVNPAGELVNVKYRGISVKDFRNAKGAQKLPVGLHTVKGVDRLILVEGELDAMSGYQYGLRNIVSVPNGTGDMDWVEDLWDYLVGFTEIVVALDADASGAGMVEKLVKRLGPARCSGVKLPDGHKDLNECLMAGVSADAIKAAFADAHEFPVADMRFVGDYRNDVLAARKRVPGQRGVMSGWPELDQTLKGFRGGELTVWSGYSGSGKSTVIGWLINVWAAAGVRCFVASLEIPKESYLWWLAMQGLGMADEQITDEDYDRWSEWVNPSYVHLNRATSITLDDLMAAFTYAVQRYNCRQFVADNLMKITCPGDPLQAQGRIVTALKDFAIEWGVHVHLVAHPKKPPQTGAHKMTKYDISGSADIPNLADNVLIVNRIKHEQPIGPHRIPDEATIKVDKNRIWGLEPEFNVAISEKTKGVKSSGSRENFRDLILLDDDIPEWTDDPPPRRTTAEPDWMNTAEPLTERRPA